MLKNQCDQEHKHHAAEASHHLHLIKADDRSCKKSQQLHRAKGPWVQNSDAYRRFSVCCAPLTCVRATRIREIRVRFNCLETHKRRSDDILLVSLAKRYGLLGGSKQVFRGLCFMPKCEKLLPLYLGCSCDSSAGKQWMV